GRRGEEVVARNVAAVEAAVAAMFAVAPGEPRAAARADGEDGLGPGVLRDLILPLIADAGDDLPVSRMPADGTFPTGTARFEKRGITDRVAGVGAGAVHRVRALRAGLPARRDQDEDV